MRWLKKIPFFLLLLVLFFCLHGWLENYGFINATEVVYPGLIIFVAIVFFCCILFLFTRNLLFSSLLIFFTSVWYLFFGALHDWIKNTAILSWLQSYSVLIPVLAAATVCCAFILWRNKKLYPKLVMFLNLLLAIYCLVDIFSLIKLQQQPPPKQTGAINFNLSKVVQRPSVYLLLFDGYPGFKSMKDMFGYNNDSLRKFFSNRSFQTWPVSSNYDLTYFSMSSIFNMKYVVDDFNNMKLTQRDFQKRGVEISQATIFSIFRSMGYEINNLSIFAIDGKAPVSNSNSFLLAHSKLLTDKIFHNRLQRDIGGRLAALIPFWPNQNFYQHYSSNKLTEKLLLENAVLKKDNPQLTYAHFMMPHGPYYYDSLGNINPHYKISHYTMWQDRSLFVSYVKYVNSRIYNMVDNIIASNPDAVIIAMGDHGFRTYRGTQIYQPSRFDNLFAVRMPGSKVEVNPPITTVNLFPYIFNSCFGQSLRYLKDSAVILRY